MHFLALDIGTRRTGVAYHDDAVSIVLPLDTVVHATFDELFDVVTRIVAERSVDHVIVGLPLLPSGKEGAQARIVRAFAGRLRDAGTSCSLLDERYTTPRSSHSDGNAEAACSLLQMAISLH